MDADRQRTIACVTYQMARQALLREFGSRAWDTHRRAVRDALWALHPVVEGWLEKKGARSRDGFKKRWFELRASYLFYYEKEGGKHKGDISMGNAVSTRFDAGEDGHPPEEDSGLPGGQ